MEGNILSRTVFPTDSIPELKLYATEQAKQPIEDVIETIALEGPQDFDRCGAGSRHGSTFRSPSATSTLQGPGYRSEADHPLHRRKPELTALHAEPAARLFGESFRRPKPTRKDNEDLTKFKNENQGRLPEQSQMNIAALTSLQTEVNGIQDGINRLGQDRMQQEAHLATTKSQMDLTEMMGQEPTGPAGQCAAPPELLTRSINKELRAEKPPAAAAPGV